MSTHEDWQKALDAQDAAARRTVRYLNNGLLDAAKAAAKESLAFEEEKERIEAELDGAHGDTCGEGPHGEPCGQPVVDGECPEHGPVGP